MSWMAIIATLVQVFGPMLAALLQKWFEKRMTKAAEGLAAPETFATEDEARNALFDSAIARCFGWRRALLQKLKLKASQMGLRVGIVPPEVPAELAGELAEIMTDETDEADE